MNFYCSVFKNSKVLSVTRDMQQEIDDYWAKLTANGGKESQCGWLKDKFGLSWQIVPSVLPEMMHDTRVRRSLAVAQRRRTEVSP